MEKKLFTSESVTEGHPDKVCDAVSDAILDACMAQDPMSRVACEAAACTGFVLVTGEITTKAQLDIPAIVRKTVLDIGYDDGAKGLDGNSCAVMVALDQQSADIAMGVDKALEAKENQMSDEEIEEYISTDEPYDKAGAYAIQGRSGVFIREIRGNYYNVVGLPIDRIYAYLKK